MNRAILVLSFFCGFYANAMAYEVGVTARELFVSNNGEYYAKETKSGIKYGIFFQPDYLVTPYLEWLSLGEDQEILPILGIRIQPKLENWWVRPRAGLNIYPFSTQLEFSTRYKRVHIGAFYERYNWGDSGWYAIGYRLNIDFPTSIK